MTDQSSALDILFEELTINSLRIRNRFVMPGMQRGFVTDYTPTHNMIDYLVACGLGGVGLIISESVSIDHPSAYWRRDFCVLREGQRDVWQRLVTAVKATGAGFIVQLFHPGAKRTNLAGEAHQDYPSLSPSGFAAPGHSNGEILTTDQMEEIRCAYIEAAVMAESLGADGVEIHGAHGFLLDQFLWHITNQRSDAYGGVRPWQRARYPADIVSGIRAAVRPNFLISYRLSQFKEADYNGTVVNSPAELADLLAVLADAGVDCFNISSRFFNRPEWTHLDADIGLAGWARQAAGKPVISVGGVGLDTDLFDNLVNGNDPQLRVRADLLDVARRIRLGQFDLIGVGRAHIANNDFVNKVGDGRFHDIKAFRKAEYFAKVI